jgi:hypothetical protein
LLCMYTASHSAGELQHTTRLASVVALCSRCAVAFRVPDPLQLRQHCAACIPLARCLSLLLCGGVSC